jgi:tRNA threonylcarbamoyladenosine biosynthesis protein TsaB
MWLGIDTSGDDCSAALFDGARLVAIRQEHLGRGHAERLVPILQTLCGTGEKRPGTIVVVVGPGSYTGIRVGVAAARALGLAWRAAVYGTTATALAAADAFAREPEASEAAAILPAQRGGAYVQRFRRIAAGFDLVSPIERVGEVQAAELARQPLAVSGPASVERLSMVPPVLRMLPPTPIYVATAGEQSSRC